MVQAYADERARFEVLMQDIHLPHDIVQLHFADAYLAKVVCSRSNKQWTFHIHKQSVVPIDAYLTFCRMVKEKYEHIAQISFVFHYDSGVSDEQIVVMYWPLLIEWMKREVVSVNGWMSAAVPTVKDGEMEIALASEQVVELAQQRDVNQLIHTFFSKYFARQFRVYFIVGTDNEEELQQFEQLIQEEDRMALMQAMAPESNQTKAKQKLMVGTTIRDEPTPIQSIVDEERRATIQGVVLNLDVKKLRNGNTLYQFIMTDYTDSLQIKMFARQKEDERALNQIANGQWLRARGKVEYDRFLTTPELVMMANDLNEILPPEQRMDEAEEKRVEFHLHTKMSTMDAITSITDYVKTAAQWGHEAIAITDHGGIQSFPEANAAAHKYDMKIIYGLEANVVNDAVPIVINAVDQPLDEATYVVFDVETTGLSVTHSKIIELAGVKMVQGEEVERFSTFIDPHERIPYNITKLTNITDDMVRGAPDIADELPKFIEFIGDAILVAHNARFDMGFLNYNCKQLGLPEVTNCVIDTLEWARFLYPTFRNHRLDTLADRLKVSLENHHRAIDDSIALGGILQAMIKEAGTRGINNISELVDLTGQDISNARPFHSCIYALNATGKKNLYKIVSLSHTQYFNRIACIPKSKLIELREGLIIASGCERGELFEAVLNKSEEEAEEIAAFYDVLEIQPVEVNMHLVERGLVASRAHLEEANRRIYKLGAKLNKPVIATGNVHYLHPRDKLGRDITINGITGFSPLKEMNKPDVHFRTTDEMLSLFTYLGEDAAYEVVVTNTRALAAQFEKIELFPDQLFTPQMEGADEEIRSTCYATAEDIYGEPLPEIVVERLEKELNPIIKYGFSANYLISERLVKKSNEDGYLVGSRGSVGSSFVATMLGISEVNPLPPHYICAQCKYSEWFTDGSLPSGFDLPDKACPKCEHPLKGEGQDIPFETFLGFKGDKVPDIDLNFSGDYQPIAHNYTKELFGEDNVFRAGTIGTIADKTAFGYVKKYEEENGKNWRSAEVIRLSSTFTGVKRSTGQHPGGIIVLPDDMEIEEITPVQYPADDVNSEWKTTHFDYHAFDDNLLKLDILGHDDPTMMRMLQDLTGVDPVSIPMNDPVVMSIFHSTDALNVTPEQIHSKVGTYGIPEMGTRFVRQMLEETSPSTFADLLQISGLSHGSGVWVGNAQELIKNGTCTIKTVIGCRDDIMLYLIYHANMDHSLAFDITESVRRGRGLKDEWITAMREHQVPQWYIDSCQKIEYMFPKAHAAAYVISAVRTAYYKVYHPLAYYATYFSIRVDDFDIETCSQGYDAIKSKLKEIENKGFQASAKERSMISMYEIALEMTARGFSFKTIDLYRSQASTFIIDGDSLIPPFSALPGVGANAALQIAGAKEEGEFLSIEDFQRKAKASKAVIELLTEMKCFVGLPESNQLSLF